MFLVIVCFFVCVFLLVCLFVSFFFVSVFLLFVCFFFFFFFFFRWGLFCGFISSFFGGRRLGWWSSLTVYYNIKRINRSAKMLSTSRKREYQVKTEFGCVWHIPEYTPYSPSLMLPSPAVLHTLCTSFIDEVPENPLNVSNCNRK